MPNFLTSLGRRALVTLTRSLVSFDKSPALDAALAEKTGIQKEEICIPSRDPGRDIPAHLYYPPGQSSSPGSDKKPILINWHGGGFVLPGLGQETLFCARMAQATGFFVLDADYRNSPEFPFPKPLEDVQDALRWVASQPARFDLSRIAVSGFSAGGCIAMVAATALRKEVPDIKIPIAIACYPLVDWSIPPGEKKVARPNKAIPLFMLNLFDDCYAPDPASRTNPLVSPALADPVDFPQTVVIVTCGGDVLAPEGDALAKKLDDGGRKVVHQTIGGAAHIFDKGCKDGTTEARQRDEMYELIEKELKIALKL